ncbi:MAG: leucyl aminopeptidase, partial [Pseudomonadota bacterium]
VEAAETEFAPLKAAADGTAVARDLVTEPPNVLHPESYAERIEALSDLGLEIKVLDEPAMAELGMGSLLGVGQGSIRGSRLCVISWMGAGDKDTAPVALVGKGVTFDTGGISLKPGAGMEDMKGDMGGSAAVVGAMVALAKRKAKANVVGLVGLVENMPDGNAIRPGDILTSASGQTIEIHNTDAEGRLVLADVLWYAQENYKPRAIVDLATLTGAIVISLGHEYAGLFSNNDDLAGQLSAAGDAEGEPVWRMPLGGAYDKLIDSPVADMKNVGGRAGGSITAAQFLQRFIENDTPWAHLDIAGTAWRPGDAGALEPTWASGYGPRLLDRWIKDNYED